MYQKYTKQRTESDELFLKIPLQNSEQIEISPRWSQTHSQQRHKNRH